jgi:hypothetical protein
LSRVRNGAAFFLDADMLCLNPDNYKGTHRLYKFPVQMLKKKHRLGEIKQACLLLYVFTGSFGSPSINTKEGTYLLFMYCVRNN